MITRSEGCFEGAFIAEHQATSQTPAPSLWWHTPSQQREMRLSMRTKPFVSISLLLLPQLIKALHLKLRIESSQIAYCPLERMEPGPPFRRPSNYYTDGTIVRVDESSRVPRYNCHV